MPDPDPKAVQFRERVEAEWAGDETAAAWQKHFPQRRQQLAAVTTALVNAADPRPGMSMLDLASGTGEPVLTLARRGGESSKVTATDLSEGMVAALRANARAEGLSNIETKICDAQDL